MEQYKVTGMSCAACSARVEKAVAKVEGVTACSVSLLTNSMGVEGTAKTEDIIKAVEAAGYGAAKKEAAVNVAEAGKSLPAEDALADKDTPVLRKRLISSVGFLALLMYVSMGHVMWGWPLPEVLAQNPMAIGLTELLLTIAVMIINKKFFTNGCNSLLHGAPNMDTLVALGSGAAFVYSTYALFAMSYALLDGAVTEAHHYLHELYFESAAMILTLITVGKLLEARSKGKTTDALKGLMRLAPKTATLERDGMERIVPVEQVKKGDIFIVRPGEQIPVDGVVTEGQSAVNEAALTGESVPAEKGPGEPVSAATMNTFGFLKCEAVRVGEDTTLSQIIKLVSDAAATKAPIAKVADKVSGVFVPVVISIAVLATVVWLFAGETVGFALARGISVLVISCPCALGLATPVAIMVGSGVGAKNGILFKTAVSLEQVGKTQIVALDKTGTITKGEPQVTDVLPAEGVSGETLLSYAAALEQRSEHPLAKAVLAHVKEKELRTVKLEQFEILPGNGLKGRTEEGMLYGGNERFIREHAEVPKELLDKTGQLAEEGKTPLYFAREGSCLGAIAVADVIKEDSTEAVSELKQMGIRVVMLTGDNEKTARAIGAQAGVDEVIAGVLPEGKERVIRELKKQGRVAMVGDGINDAPALTQADVGIAIGAGTDVAIDAADVVLMKNSVGDVPAAIRLSRATLRNIHQNLFWAFFYNSIGIPLAAGVFIPAFDWQLNPMFGAAAMSLSSFCVVTNALRLNLVRVYNERKDIKEKTAAEAMPLKEDKTMKKTMKIEGMMCGHCEARVKKTLEAIEGVATAEVNHTEGTAVVTLNAPVADEVLKKAVEDQDYPVTSIQ